MASYKQDPNTKTWCVRFRVKEFDRVVEKRKRGFKTKKAAEYWYYQFQNMKNAEKNGTSMTVKQLFALYEADIKERLKTSSVKSACDVIRLYVIPQFGNRHVDKLTTQDIREWKTFINNKGFKFKYKSKIYCGFSAMLNFAVKYYNLPYNVVNKCGNFANNEPKHEMQFWTEEEFKQFISVVDDIDFKTFFSLLYLTGCRKGEALALTWNDIDFNKNIIHVKKSINRKGLENKSFEITTPKNKASYRDILMPNNLQTLLLDYKQECSSMDGFCKNSFVFGVNVPFTEQTIRRRLNEYASLAGVKQIRVHDFRHSHASLLINKGQNILIVSQRLGHSDITQTLNTYGHLFPNAQREIIDAINIDL